MSSPMHMGTGLNTSEQGGFVADVAAGDRRKTATTDSLPEMLRAVLRLAVENWPGLDAETIEDALDTLEADAATEEMNREGLHPISWEQARKELGL